MRGAPKGITPVRVAKMPIGGEARAEEHGDREGRSGTDEYEYSTVHAL